MRVFQNDLLPLYKNSSRGFAICYPLLAFCGYSLVIFIWLSVLLNGFLSNLNSKIKNNIKLKLLLTIFTNKFFGIVIFINITIIIFTNFYISLDNNLQDAILSASPLSFIVTEKMLEQRTQIRSDRSIGGNLFDSAQRGDFTNLSYSMVDDCVHTRAEANRLFRFGVIDAWSSSTPYPEILRVSKVFNEMMDEVFNSSIFLIFVDSEIFTSLRIIGIIFKLIKYYKQEYQLFFNIKPSFYLISQKFNTYLKSGSSILQFSDKIFIKLLSGFTGCAILFKKVLDILTETKIHLWWFSKNFNNCSFKSLLGLNRLKQV